MRRRISLNSLKRIISESVARTLNELDWKTYQHAGEEVRRILNTRHSDADSYDRMKKYASRTGNPYGWDARMYGFFDKAREAFNNEYGYDKDKKKYSNTGANPYDDGTIKICTSAERKNGRKTDGLGYLNGEPWCARDSKKDKKYRKFRDGDENMFADDDEFTKTIKRGNDEVNDYKSGKYKYTPGKGWLK